MDHLPTGTHPCKCPRKRHKAQLVVLTGGPGGGKTAILEMARRYFCRHVILLPEAASIVFSGGFPRMATDAGRRAAQHAIYSVQREMERLAEAVDDAAVILCDRGTVDGLAYWPGTPRGFFHQHGATMQGELERYASVIHVETASPENYAIAGTRVEPVNEAKRIDARIRAAWDRHPLRYVIASSTNFLDKASLALELVRAQVPPCCRVHPHIPANEAAKGGLR
jgi:predicted ATPase